MLTASRDKGVGWLVRQLTNHVAKARDYVVDAVTRNPLAAIGIASRVGNLLGDLKRGRTGLDRASDWLTATEIRDGCWNNTKVGVWRVTCAEPGLRMLLSACVIAQTRRGRQAVFAHLRSLAHGLGQTVGRTFQAAGGAVPGATRCRIARFLEALDDPKGPAAAAPTAPTGHPLNRPTMIKTYVFV